MSWAHVSGSGAQVTTGSQATLSATFPGTIAAGDLIVVSVAWYGTSIPSVTDSINAANYVYAGPSASSQQVGTWYYTASSGGSGFSVTVNGNGSQFMSMAIDAYTFTSGFLAIVESNLYSSGSGLTASSSSLPVSSSDLIYAACIENGSAGTVTAGTGFTLRYSGAFVGGTAFGIASEDYVNESSPIAPSFGFTNSIPWGVNAVAFKTAIYHCNIEWA